VILTSPGDPAPPVGSVVCALVNNMPDGAFIRTETQFLRLLAAGLVGRDVYVARYTLVTGERGPDLVDHITASYHPLSDLWDSPASVVVVTGAEPLTASLPDETYWAPMTRVFDWAVDRCDALLVSCLAAHAALAHFDGIQRSRLPAKCSGVYDHDVARDHRLTYGLPARCPLPHSRFNGVDDLSLTRSGYDILLSSEVGWGVAATRRAGCELLLFQGHPEYDPDTLLREYRRDLWRHFEDGASARPAVPAGYLDPADVDRLETLSAVTDQTAFPFEELCGRLRGDWAVPVERLCANWLAPVARSAPLRTGSSR
jgi:homoserine O-succinyltransferase